MTALLLTHHRAAAAGAQLRVVVGSPSMRRILEPTAADQVLNTYALPRRGARRHGGHVIDHDPIPRCHANVVDQAAREAGRTAARRNDAAILQCRGRDGPVIAAPHHERARPAVHRHARGQPPDPVHKRRWCTVDRRPAVQLPHGHVSAAPTSRSTAASPPSSPSSSDPHRPQTATRTASRSAPKSLPGFPDVAQRQAADRPGRTTRTQTGRRPRHSILYEQDPRRRSAAAVYSPVPYLLRARRPARSARPPQAPG